MAKQAQTEWVPSIEDFCAYWELPARHVLIEARTGADRVFIELLVHHAPDDISLVPASIYDPASGQHHTTHCELVIREQITPDLLTAGTWPAARAWNFDRQVLLVCADVRDALVDSDADIVFSPGFFGWA